jgi:hypothetical protein
MRRRYAGRVEQRILGVFPGGLEPLFEGPWEVLAEEGPERVAGRDGALAGRRRGDAPRETALGRLGQTPTGELNGLILTRVFGDLHHCSRGF